MPTDSAGLGLAIVPKILDLHGSRITVSSEIDADTTFAFDLPAAQAACRWSITPFPKPRPHALGLAATIGFSHPIAREA